MIIERKKKERYINVFKRPKWPIRPNKRLHLKCFLVFRRSKRRRKRREPDSSCVYVCMHSIYACTYVCYVMSCIL